jgi:lysozyme
MKISDQGLAIVKAFEGCLKPVPGRAGHYKPYVCPGGVLTIGWGHTNHHPPRFDRGTVWSAQECDEALRGDMATFEAHVRRRAPEVTIQNRFDALVSWSYNTGGPASSAVWTYARAGDVAGTVERLARWNKGGGKVLAGLVRRRKSEGELFAGRIDQALRTAGAIRFATGQPMPQRSDRPRPPAREVARQVQREAGGAAAGTAIGTGSTQIPQQDGGMGVGAWVGVAIGALIVAVAVFAAVRRGRAFIADWA